MPKCLILIHPEALRADHPVFKFSTGDTQSIFVWDEKLFKELNYSMKRLIFIYESLIELPVDIIHGSTFEMITACNPEKILIPSTHNPVLNEYYQALRSIAPLEVIEDEAFVTMKSDIPYSRFFQYWNKAKKLAMRINGN
jgi:hypothetical protein